MLPTKAEIEAIAIKQIDYFKWLLAERAESPNQKDIYRGYLKIWLDALAFSDRPWHMSNAAISEVRRAAGYK